MRQTELSLSEADRVALGEFRSKGSHRSREVNRAQVLMALDRGISEGEICRVWGLGRSALWRTRVAYGEGGWESALYDAPRTGQPRQYQTDQEAEVVALAGSTPPGGRKRWTVRLLTDAARQRPGLGTVNRETIRQMLKKTMVNRGAS